MQYHKSDQKQNQNWVAKFLTQTETTKVKIVGVVLKNNLYTEITQFYCGQKRRLFKKHLTNFGLMLDFNFCASDLMSPFSRIPQR